MAGQRAVSTVGRKDVGTADLLVDQRVIELDWLSEILRDWLSDWRSGGL